MNFYCDVQLPPSKSESHRVLMIAAYGGFEPEFQNLSESNDTKVLNAALSNLPFIHSRHDAVQRQNDIKGKPQVIDVADCGTAARFMTTFLASHKGTWLLTGTERMKQRPIRPLVNALRQLGADIQHLEKEDFLPLLIHGKPLEGGNVAIDITQSSQFASSLLLAAPMWSQGLELELLGKLNSLPYIDMTLSLMRHFGADAERNGRIIYVEPKPYQFRNFVVSSDWTAASYWYEIAALSDECEIKLRFLNPSKSRPNMQGDAIIAEWMQHLGVGSFPEGEDIVLRKIPFEKRSLHFDFSQHPDLYPTMAATFAGLHLESHFTGLDNLSLKESDRVDAMQTELSKLGQQPLHFCAHNDHRIVMAMAPLSILFGPVTFDHPEVVEKSYPDFWKDASFLPVER